MTIHMNESQCRFFETFGYVGMPGLLKEDIEDIINAFEEVWQTNGGGHAGKPHEGTARSCIAQFLDHHPRLCALLDDPRILGIAKSLCGDDFNYMGSDGNYYVGDTGWHSDGWHPQIRHIKIAFYLDPLTKDTGCLRVIPGSHRLGEGYTEELQANLRHSREKWDLTGPEIPAIALETVPGDVLVFNHNTKAVLFNNPLNPAAVVYPREDLELLARFCQQFDTIAICDEVWEHVIFDGREHIPLITIPGMRDRTIKVGSAGKIFSLT